MKISAHFRRLYASIRHLGWLVEVLLYVHRNRRLIRDGSPGRPPRLSHSSWALIRRRFDSPLSITCQYTSLQYTLQGNDVTLLRCRLPLGFRARMTEPVDRAWRVSNSWDGHYYTLSTTASLKMPPKLCNGRVQNIHQRGHYIMSRVTISRARARLGTAFFMNYTVFFYELHSILYDLHSIF